MSAPKALRIIGAPTDLGAGRRGVDMGPSAVRVADLERRLEALGIAVEDAGNLTVGIPETQAIGHQRLRYKDCILALSETLCAASRAAVAEGRVPLVLGGDHSIALGSVAGSTGAFAERGEKLGLLWFDAHGDMNTPETTPSGNIHGMALALALGLGDPQLAQVGGRSPKVAPANAALIGARDLDPGERDNMRAAGIHVFTMHEVDSAGIRSVMERALAAVENGTTALHVSFDMDVLDPDYAPGTGTPVPGGISYREAHLALEMVADHGRVAAMDLVEINPILDVRNITADLGVELILSAMGKRIY